MVVPREIFRKAHKFVVVRHIRLSSKYILEPGFLLSDLDKPLRAFHVRSLYDRRRIGVVGSVWANMMLSNPAKFVPLTVEKSKVPTAAEVEAEAKAKAEAEADAPVTDDATGTGDPIHDDAVDMDPVTPDADDELKPVKVDGKWTVEGTDRVFTSRKKANAWIEEQGS